VCLSGRRYCDGPGDEHYAEALLRDALDSYQGSAASAAASPAAASTATSSGSGCGGGGGGAHLCGMAVATKGGMARTSALASGWAPRKSLDEHGKLRALVLKQRAALNGSGVSDSGGKPIFLWQLHHTDG